MCVEVVVVVVVARRLAATAPCLAATALAVVKVVARLPLLAWGDTSLIKFEFYFC